MRTISVEELKTILENHKHWLNEDCEGWEDMRANLINADLSDANLRYANLRAAAAGVTVSKYIHGLLFPVQ